MKEFSDRIRFSRKHANLTQNELAKSVGLSRVAVTQWENGEVHHIRPENLFPVAKKLGVDPEWLALGEENPQPSSPSLSINDPPNNNHAYLSVEALRQALPYIHIHQNKTFVIHLPDEAVFSASFHSIVHDLTLLASLGIQIVLVHGARNSINKALKTTGLTPELTQGIRITSKSMLPTIQQAVGAVKLEIEAHFSMGAANTPMSHAKVRIVSGNLITAQPIGIINGIDFASSGKVRRLDTKAINQHLSQQYLVLLSPVGYSATGETFNLSSTELAHIVAEQLHASKLIYLAEAFNPETCLPLHLSLKKVDALTAQYPLLQRLKQACQRGVQRGHLLEYSMNGALLSETLTRDGCGLMVTADPYEDVRSACMHDIPGLMEILTPLESSGVLIQRSRECLEKDIENFYVLEKEGMIMGCAALYPYPKDNTAELACLATHTTYQRRGCGEILLQYIAATTQKNNLKTLFVLTTQSMNWFLERGFSEGSPNDLPDNKQTLYNWQRNSKILIKKIPHRLKRLHL